MLIQINLATLRNAHGVGQGLRVLAKKQLHLLRRFQIKLAVGETHPQRVAAQAARLHAKQHIMPLRVLPVDIMAIVGANQANIQIIGQFN